LADGGVQVHHGVGDGLEVIPFVPYTEPPIVLGHEAVGRVVAVGSGVSEFAPGDTVVTCLSAYCGTYEYCVTGRQA
jgi:D-arabinose 1-dehydrogenase-like Zn-dependent alcohol dehydrogenase